MNSQVAPLPYIVSAAQMQSIESQLFANGMPIAALMEKAGLSLSCRIMELFPRSGVGRVGVLVGPGHNGGDALVVARELWLQGYWVEIVTPLPQVKPLTESHLAYATYLGIPVHQSAIPWNFDLIVDGLFGFGLTRSVTGELATLIEQINADQKPVVSLDIPSGLHTDTGQVLGTAIAATHTLCLGLWKRAFFQEQALNYVGQSELIPFGIPQSEVLAALASEPPLQILPRATVTQYLTAKRSPTVHKYEVGAALLVCGSRQYPGAALLAAKAARTTGVGMLYVAVPQSLQALVVGLVPDAIVLACPEDGAIAHLPNSLDISRIQAIAVGPGLSLAAQGVVEHLLTLEKPLILDADALNILAQQQSRQWLSDRPAPTLLTPHWGEFKRLFPAVLETEAAQQGDRITVLSELRTQMKTAILLKGARTLISCPDQPIYINPHSTPALARGGSGDVLTGMLVGLWAQFPQDDLGAIAAAAVAWHSQAAIHLAQQKGQGSVHPMALIDSLETYRANLVHGEKI